MTGERVEAAFAAAGSGDLDGRRAALDAEPALISARGAHGVTLLHPAAQRDDLPMVETLLERGVDPRARASLGHTPFEWAATLGARGRTSRARGLVGGSGRMTSRLEVGRVAARE